MYKYGLHMHLISMWLWQQKAICFQLKLWFKDTAYTTKPFDSRKVKEFRFLRKKNFGDWVTNSPKFSDATIFHYTVKYTHTQPYLRYTAYVKYSDIQIIKTHDSESRGQEEAAIICETKITRPLSELFTKKIANALAKLP